MKFLYLLIIWFLSSGIVRAQKTQLCHFSAYHYAFMAGFKGDDIIELNIGSLPSSSPIYIGFGNDYNEAQRNIGVGYVINKSIGDNISGARISSIVNDPSKGYLTIKIHWWYNFLPGNSLYALIVWLNDAEAQNVLHFPMIDSYIYLDDKLGPDGIGYLVPAPYRPEGYAAIKRNQAPTLFSGSMVTFYPPK